MAEGQGRPCVDARGGYAGWEASRHLAGGSTQDSLGAVLGSGCMPYYPASTQLLPWLPDQHKKGVQPRKEAQPAMAAAGGDGGAPCTRFQSWLPLKFGVHDQVPSGAAPPALSQGGGRGGAREGTFKKLRGRAVSPCSRLLRRVKGGERTLGSEGVHTRALAGSVLARQRCLAPQASPGSSCRTTAGLGHLNRRVVGTYRANFSPRRVGGSRGLSPLSLAWRWLQGTQATQQVGRRGKIAATGRAD